MESLTVRKGACPRLLPESESLLDVALKLFTGFEFPIVRLSKPPISCIRLSSKLDTRNSELETPSAKFQR
jgi:hypothetical protein